jgi:hypothetical protein
MSSLRRVMAISISIYTDNIKLHLVTGIEVAKELLQFWLKCYAEG